MCRSAVDEKYKMTCESVHDVMSQSNRATLLHSLNYLELSSYIVYNKIHFK